MKLEIQTGFSFISRSGAQSKSEASKFALGIINDAES